jgi:ParB family chromosome partitioning protein
MHYKLAIVPVDHVFLRAGSMVPNAGSRITKEVLRQMVSGVGGRIGVCCCARGYQVVYGDLQYLVYKKRKEKTIEVELLEGSRDELIVARLCEAGKRRELNPVEESELMYELCNEYGYTQDEVALRCNRVQSTVANKIRLLKLPGEVLAALKNGDIGERHARALLSLKNDSDRLRVFRRCIKHGYSAREMEEIASGLGGKGYRSKGRNSKGYFKDPRIFQNSLRQVVKEMSKAGLRVEYAEETAGGIWHFRVSLRS